MQTAWNQKTKLDKVLLVLRLTASVGAVVCSLLHIFLIWDKALHVAVPLIGIQLLIQSVQEWRKNRISAVLGFCAALFIFACCAAVWITFY